MTKKQIEQRFMTMPMNKIDEQEIFHLAFPNNIAVVSQHYKHPTLVKMLCSCGNYSSEYGHKYPAPIRHGDDFECPHCHQTVEVVGSITNYPYNPYQHDCRLVRVFEHHDGCDFIRTFWCDVYWSNGSRYTDVFEAWRYIYDEHMNELLMRRTFHGPDYRWYMRPYDKLRFIPTNLRQENRLDEAVHASMGELSERFMKAHVETEMGQSCWLRQWIAEIQDPQFDPRMETLLEKGQWEAFIYNLRRGGEPSAYWPQIKMAMKRDYYMSSMWFDELRVMKQLGIDITQPENIFPENLQKQHDIHNKQLQKKEEQLRLKRRIEEALAKLPEYEKKYAEPMMKKILKYGNCVLTAPGITITPLKTIREFADEGNDMQHCVYTNEYFKISDYLVMSAKNEFGQRLETVTVSLKEKKIVVSLGKHNKYSYYHSRIQYLVNKAMNNILAGKPFDLPEFPQSVLESEFTNDDVLKEQNHLPSIFTYREEEERFDDIRFKKAYQADGNEVVIALKIYSDTEENELWTDKNGSEAFFVTKARVIGIYDINGRLTDMKKAQSYHDRSFEYEVGTDCKPANEGKKGAGIYCWDTFGGAKSYWFNQNVQFQGAAA